MLEWLVYGRMIGITDFLIFSNHCDDGTVELLDHLDDLGLVRHLPNPSVFLGQAQHHRLCLSYAVDHKEFRRADYALIIDVDEFIDIRVADSTLPGLLAANGMPDIISISELLFGFGGNVAFRDGLVLEQFTRSARVRPGPHRARRGVKSIMRVSNLIEHYSNHRPQVATEALKDIRWLNGAGKPVLPEFMTGKDRGHDVRGTYAQALLCHYTLRSAESLLAKFERGDAVRPARMEPRYFRKRDGGDIENNRMARHVPAVKSGLAELLEDKELARLHQLTVAHHRSKIGQLKEAPGYAELWREIEAAAQQAARPTA